MLRCSLALPTPGAARATPERRASASRRCHGNRAKWKAGLGVASPRALSGLPGREAGLGPGQGAASGRPGRPPACALGACSACSASPSLARLQPCPAHSPGSRQEAYELSGLFHFSAGRFLRGGAQSPISFLQRRNPRRRRLDPLASDTPALGPALCAAPEVAWAAPGTWAGWRRAWSSRPAPATASTS